MTFFKKLQALILTRSRTLLDEPREATNQREIERMSVRPDDVHHILEHQTKRHRLKNVASIWQYQNKHTSILQYKFEASKPQTNKANRSTALQKKRKRNFTKTRIAFAQRKKIGFEQWLTNGT